MPFTLMRGSCRKSWGRRAAFSPTTGTLRRVVLAWSLALWVSGAVGSAVAADRSTDPAAAVAQARAAGERGDFETAIQRWEAAANLYTTRKNHAGAAAAYAGWAHAGRTLGFYDLAGAAARKAVASAAHADGRAQAQAGHALGAVAAGLGRPGAETLLTGALGLAEAAGDAALGAEILASLGDAHTARKEWAKAADYFTRAAARAEQAGNAAQQGLALARKANADLRQSGDAAFALETAARAERLATALAASHNKAGIFLVLGGVEERAGAGAAKALGLAGGPPALRGGAAQERARARYDEALRAATECGDVRSRSLALGQLGELALAAKQSAEALEFSQQAVFAAQRGNLVDVVHRWHWNAAKACVQLQRPDEAVQSYRRAVQAVRAVQNDLILGHSVGQREGSFREVIGPLFYELADLLLQRAARETDPAVVGQILFDTRNELESLKSAELDDFFRDHCVNTVRARAKAVDQTDPKSAVLYVVPLPDRTELLVGTVAGIRRFQVPVTGPVLMETAQEFRRKLEKRTTHQYRVTGRKLYQWLIAPVAELLRAQGIETLVVVPDGALRTIPLGALMDGETFLIQQFAVAVSPGLTLLSPEKFAHVPPRFLSCGLSVDVNVTNAPAGAVCAEPKPEQPADPQVSHFAGLEHVPGELSAVQGLFGGTVLRDQDFRLKTVRGELEKNPVSVLHIASHAEFGATAQDTFLVTFEGKLTLDDLEALVKPRKYRGQPLELLALSACQTASGDDRAALGLAGAAVKAGARSTLATLWSVHDEASAKLVTEFYSQIRRQPDLARAQALRQAQLKLIAQEPYFHPAFWSPFLIIGNWL